MSILFLGASRVGKTVIIESLSQQPHSHRQEPTIETSVTFQYIVNAATWPALNRFFREFAPYLIPSQESLGHTRVLELMELGGDPCLDSLLASHVVAADTIAFVFDLFDHSSFERLWELYQKVACTKGDSISRTPMILLGMSWQRESQISEHPQLESRITDQAIQGMSKLLHIPYLNVSLEDSPSYRFGVDVLILWLQSLPAVPTAQHRLRKEPGLLQPKKTSSLSLQRDKLFAALNIKTGTKSMTASEKIDALLEELQSLDFADKVED